MVKILFLLGCFNIVMPALYSQNCDQDLKPIDDDNLKYKFRTNRCEGLYESDITTFSLKLVSLTCGSFSYELLDSEVLNIRPLYDNNSEIHIKASALQLGKYYRMDSYIHSRQNLSWPVKDVLMPTDLSDNKIGICAWMEEENITMPVSVPLVVKTDSSVNSTCKELYMIFTSNIDLDLIAYSIKSTKNNEEVQLKQLPNKIYYAGTPIRFQVDITSFTDRQLFFISGLIYNPENLGGSEEEESDSISLYFVIDLPAQI